MRSRNLKVPNEEITHCGYSGKHLHEIDVAVCDFSWFMHTNGHRAGRVKTWLRPPCLEKRTSVAKAVKSTIYGTTEAMPFVQKRFSLQLQPLPPNQEFVQNVLYQGAIKPSPITRFAEPIGCAKRAPRRGPRNTVSRARLYRCGTP